MWPVDLSQVLFVTRTMPIEDALIVIERAGLRIALVVDEEQRLQGTLTDGDIRRAIIAHSPLSTPVGNVMNANPISAVLGTSRNRLLELMTRRDVQVVPLLDTLGRVVGIETLNGLLTPRPVENWVFLMAGGFGTRLRPLTDNCPKPMLHVGGKPILESILESFIASGFHKFYISVHFMPDAIKEHFGDGSRWGVTIRYVEESEPLGTGGALGLLPTTEERPLIMMNGDLLTRVNCLDLLRYHVNQDAAMTVCVREFDQQVPFGVVEGDGLRIRGIVEKPVQKFLVNAGIYCLSPDVVAQVKRNTPMDMPDLARALIADGKTVAMLPISEYWLDIGHLEDYERVNREFFEYLK